MRRSRFIEERERFVNRRELMKLGASAILQASAARFLRADIQDQMQMSPAAAPETTKADFTLRIAPITVELAPNHIISTIGYNGTSPGPLLRMREEKPVTVDVMRGSWRGVGYVAYGLAVSLNGISITGYSRIRSLRFGASETNSTFG